MSEELRRTPFHDEHRRLQGKLVPFNGWEMPLQYAAGMAREHEAVRTAAGLFDVAHMARFEIQGPGSVAFIDTLITNDLAQLPVGRLLYSPMCSESAGVLDDVIVYRLPETVLVVANAGNRGRIWEWLEERRLTFEGLSTTLTDRSDEWAHVALQGPKAQAILSRLTDGDLEPIVYYGWERFTVAGIADTLVSRNGYTGEDGFELYVPSAAGPTLWRALLEEGAAFGILPAGLGCRDTLRLEMAYCLYGHELDLETTPLQARLQWTVKLKKNHFVGRDALLAEKAAGLPRVLVGFRVEGNRFARQGQAILDGSKEIGRVSSGGPSPTLRIGIGLGYVAPAYAAPGTRLAVDVRGAPVPIEVVPVPFYTQASHR